MVVKSPNKTSVDSGISLPRKNPMFSDVYLVLCL